MYYVVLPLNFQNACQKLYIATVLSVCCTISYITKSVRSFHTQNKLNQRNSQSISCKITFSSGCRPRYLTAPRRRWKVGFLTYLKGWRRCKTRLHLLQDKNLVYVVASFHYRNDFLFFFFAIVIICEPVLLHPPSSLLQDINKSGRMPRNWLIFTVRFWRKKKTAP